MFRILLAAALLVAGAVLASPDGASATHPLPHEPYDHLACYKVQEFDQFRARVALDAGLSQLDIPPTCKVVGRSLAYCAPVRKHVLRLRYQDGAGGIDGMEPIDMPGDHQREGRLCYRVKCPVEPFTGPLLVEDQFGRHAIRDFQLKRLCTNARVIDSPNPTTTTTTTTMPQDPCALVDCLSGHHCRPTCDDPSVAECVPFVPEDGVCGGFVPPCMLELCEPGLQCVVPPGIPDIPGICVDLGDGSCRGDDDCPQGEVCEPGPPGAAGQIGASVCVPGCHEDVQCGPGHSCRKVECVTTPCPGFCVPEKCGDCYSDADCPEILQCNVHETCMVACDCPLCAVCAGECVPRPIE